MRFLWLLRDNIHVRLLCRNYSSITYNRKPQPWVLALLLRGAGEVMWWSSGREVMLLNSGIHMCTVSVHRQA